MISKSSVEILYVCKQAVIIWRPSSIKEKNKKGILINWGHLVMSHMIIFCFPLTFLLSLLAKTEENVIVNNLSVWNIDMHKHTFYSGAMHSV